MRRTKLPRRQRQERERLWPGEPTRVERRKAQARRIKRLRKQDDRVCRALAWAMKACRPHRPCGLAACARRCAPNEQRRMFLATRALWGGTPLTKVTMVVVGLQRPLDDLGSLKITSVKRHLRRIFERAGVDHHAIVGFIDVSLNIHTGGEWEPHWQPHLEFLVPTDVWEAMKKPLRRQLSTSRSVKRPLRGVKVKNFDRQASYATKHSPIRRTSFFSYSPKARPHKQRLKALQEVVFLKWIDQSPASCRNFMIHARSYGKYLILF